MATFIPCSLRGYHKDQKKELVVNNNTEQIDASQHVEFLLDRQEQWDIRDLVNSSFKGEFKVIEDIQIQAQEVFWMRITIYNSSFQHKNLVFKYPNSLIHEVELYETLSDGSILVKKAGYSVRANERAYNYRYPVFLVNFNGKERRTIYLRASAGFQHVPLQISSIAEFNRESNHNQIVVGLFLGTLGSLLLYNLLLWVSARLTYYLYYIVSQALFFVHTIIYEGELFIYTSYAYNTYWINFSLNTLVALIFICFLKFTQEVFQLNSLAPKLHRILSIFIGLFFLYIPLYFFNSLMVSFIIDMTSVISGIVLFGISLHLNLKGYKPSYYFSASLSLLSFNLIISNYFYYTGTENQFTPTIIDYIFYIGLALMAILFSLVLASFINELNRKKSQSQIEAFNNLQAFNKLKNEYTESLEQKVIERTEEIEIQNKQLLIQSEKLKELDKAKSGFFANISHELRTPLTLILGHVRASIDEKYGQVSENLRANLEVCHKNGKRLNKIIEEILDLSKLESNQLKLKEKPVLLNGLLNMIQDTFNSYLVGKKIVFSYSIKLDDRLVVLIDEDKFQKIVMNLLSNAAKFTPNGGVIQMEVIEMMIDNTESLRLVVTDNGRGIHPDDLPHIFDRFYQSERRDAAMEGGTGIGLTLARELAVLMGGKLTAESLWGEGSNFILTFPKKTTRIAKDEFLPSIVSPMNIKHVNEIEIGELPIEYRFDHTILIVEDHSDMRRFIRQEIEHNFHILEAEDGFEALEVIEKSSVDLIISDVMMPRLDGFQLLEKLRSQPATKDISVIMLTARALQEDRLHALTIGVDDYLTKPFDVKELIARIRYTLRNKRKKEQWVDQLPDEGNEVISADQQFLKYAEEAALRAISNPNYGVFQMAQELNISQRQLFRKVKAITGLSPLQFIREIRLQKARLLLENKGKETIAEIMYAVGFQKSDYFARIYRERFGLLPSAVISS